MEKPVIGLDYGNFYAQLGIFLGMNKETRTGGTYLDLQDPTMTNPNGIPTAFFRSASRNGGKPCFGNQAEKSRPVSNIVRYMKRRLRETVTLDGQTFEMGEIITQTAQYCIRLANKQLQAQTQMTSNLVGLAYPNTMEARDRAYFIACVERATLEDGTPVKVVGTIKEAAAAALSYAAEHPGNRNSTVMAYDLGAGTFDLTVLQVYPEGKRRSDGSVYYYDPCWSDGLEDLGGREFDKVLFDHLVRRENLSLTGAQADVLMMTVETAKRDLTTDDEVYPDLMFAGVFDCEPVTIEQFNALAEPLVMKTVQIIRAALNEPGVPKAEQILLTGGASQMRIVKQVLEREFPQYRGKIILHKPSKAISMGAARFAVREEDSDPQVIQHRTTFDLGIRHSYRKSSNSESSHWFGYIVTKIPGETPLPYSSGEGVSYTSAKTQYAALNIYEANRKNPDTGQVLRDYNYVMGFEYDYGKEVPKDTPICHELVIDQNNVMHIHAWQPGRKMTTMQTKTCIYTPKQ